VCWVIAVLCVCVVVDCAAIGALLMSGATQNIAVSSTSRALALAASPPPLRTGRSSTEVSQPRYGGTSGMCVRASVCCSRVDVLCCSVACEQDLRWSRRRQCACDCCCDVDDHVDDDINDDSHISHQHEWRAHCACRSRAAIASPDRTSRAHDASPAARHCAQ
jgi:hypothetical protein